VTNGYINQNVMDTTSPSKRRETWALNLPLLPMHQNGNFTFTAAREEIIRGAGLHLAGKLQLDFLQLYRNAVFEHIEVDDSLFL
jgi:hypothetical protein